MSTSVTIITHHEATPAEPVTGSPAEEIRDRATGRMSQPILGRNGGAREWYVVDERQVRIGAWVIAAVLVIASGLWAWRSRELWTDRTAEGICTACSNAAFQWPQAVLAGIGIVLGLVLVGYLIRIAATGRVWPYRRMVTIAFLSVASVWSLLVVAVVLGPF